MLRKVVTVVMGLLLVATYCFAQNMRPSPYVSVHPGNTQLTSLTLSGTDDKVPGVLILRGSGADAWQSDADVNNGGTSNDANSLYYLWVDDTGDLMLCSYTTMATYSSFPSGTWTSRHMGSCSKVGSQS